MLETREKDAAAVKESEQTRKLLEETARQLAELRAKQEEAAKRQQLEIDQIKGQIVATHTNNGTTIPISKLSWMWDMVSKLNERKMAAAEEEQIQT